jgi:release factor glutamine methyltransferase
MPSVVKKVFFRDYEFNVWADVYEPAEDSLLFAENVVVSKEDAVLDMGTGCGILGVVAAAKAASVVAVDINPHAVRCAKENANINHVGQKMFFVQGDLFMPVSTGKKFDLILFNAPYLPSPPNEDDSWLGRAWSGGATGRQVIDRFIRDSPKHLKPTGRIFLLQSTLSNVDETVLRFREHGLESVIVADRTLPFFETVILLEIKR